MAQTNDLSGVLNIAKVITEVPCLSVVKLFGILNHKLMLYYLH